jgi:hypothetical protein
MKATVICYAAFLVLVMKCSFLEAQKPDVSGMVQDSESFEAIPYANISFTGTRLGCSTNLEGEFSVVLDTLPVYMIISHLGYETQRIWLENTSAGLNILMKPVVKLLTEVEIKSENTPVPFFKDEHYAVLDYEVDNSLVYLLIYRYRMAKSELICMTDDGDTIAITGLLGFKPTGLFADCLGYIHVLSADSAYQVFLGKDMMTFPHKASIRKFHSTMSNCVASTSDLLYFREESPDHLKVNFFWVNRKNKLKRYLASTTDQEKLNLLRNNSYDYYLLVMDTLPNTDAEMIEWVWANKILYKPNLSVLEKIGDSLVIFNTTDGAVDLYSLDGMYLSGSKIPIQRKSDEKWSSEILIDQITHIPYTYFVKHGRFIVYRIDLASGELSRKLTTGHVFPQKLRIHGNSIFYLYNLPGTDDNKHLFKQYF